jgi:nesprin-1
VLNQKIEDHKSFFNDTAAVQKQFAAAMQNSPLVSQIPSEQLESIRRRLADIGPRADMRGVKLKYLEHKCCIVAFLVLTESKLKNWTIKYGSEEKVRQIIGQYRTFVSKNKIFQEFQKAYVEFQQVCDEYKKEGGISRAEADQIDKFIKEVGERWRGTSTELRCVQSLLEEVVQHWGRWNSLVPEFESYLVTAYEMLNHGEEEQAEFFSDISSWKEKYVMLSDTVAFLMATCDYNTVGAELKTRMDVIINNWEQLFGFVEKFMHAGDISRHRREYQQGLEKLDAWLRHVEEVLNLSQKVETEAMRQILEQLMLFHSEVGAMEDLFKGVSRQFQALVPELNADEIEDMMFVLKKEKENLVIVRSLIPTKIQLYHQILTQLEALDAGETDILGWCGEADALLATLTCQGSREQLAAQLEAHRGVFIKTVNMQAMLQSKNNVFQSMLKATEGKEGIELGQLRSRMAALNEKFANTIEASRQTEARLQAALKCWAAFLDGQTAVMKWIQEAQQLIAVKHIESKESVEAHKAFFFNNNDQLMAAFVAAASELQPFIAEAEQAQLTANIGRLQEKWNEIQAFAPLHLIKVEFRLDEDTFLRYVKEVEKELAAEAASFHKNENVATILRQHEEFFAANNSAGLMAKIGACVASLGRLGQALADRLPKGVETDGSIAMVAAVPLQEAVMRHKATWDLLQSRVDALRTQLKQIPEQWRAYDARFAGMAAWMDAIDASLGRMFRKNSSSGEEFEAERGRFQDLCEDVEERREDMKWLVQQLDQLVSHRLVSHITCQYLSDQYR